MEPRIYKETGRRLWLHLAVGVVLVAVPVPLGLRGLFGLMFFVGAIVLLLALWAVFRHLAGLSEYVRVSSTGVDYVDPLRKSRSVSLPLADLRSARYEEKKFGITGRKKEMCAVVAVAGGKKLTLTERFLAPDMLEELAEQVTRLIQERDGLPAPSEGQGTPEEEPTEPVGRETGPEESGEAIPGETIPGETGGEGAER